MLLCGCWQINFRQYRFSQTPTGPAAKKAIKLGGLVCNKQMSFLSESMYKRKPNLKDQQIKSRLFAQMRPGINVVALPVDSGYATLGHLVEREHAVEAIRTDGTSLGLFRTAVTAAAALVEAARAAQTG